MEYAKLLGSTAAILIACSLYYYRGKTENDPVLSILAGLLRAEDSLPARGDSRKVAVGFGACMDVFTEAVPLLDALNLTSPEEPLHHDVVDTGTHLAEVLAYFFKYGAAAERYVSDGTVFSDWVEHARRLEMSRNALGGNAPVMANRLAREGCSVLLGAKMSGEAAKQLQNDVQLAGNITADHRDDVHLIMEYDKGEHWGRYEAPRANRFIIHSDYSNLMLESLNDFILEVVTFQPNLVVIGGLQMMDNFPFDLEIRSRKIQELKTFLMSLPKSTLVHFEMASLVEEFFLKQIINELFPHVDSLGMNEQELANLAGLMTGKNVTTVTNANPRVASALDDMRTLIFSLKEIQKGYRTISRLHIHTLAYQAIITREDSKWKHTASAAAKASLTASRYVCGSHVIDPEKMRLILDQSFSTSVAVGSERVMVNEDDPVSCWNEKEYNICVAPNLVCTKIIQTGGAGDNISAVGIASQI